MKPGASRHEHGSPVVRALFFVEPRWLQGLLAAFGIGLGLWMYRLPSR